MFPPDLKKEILDCRFGGIYVLGDMCIGGYVNWGICVLGDFLFWGLGDLGIGWLGYYIIGGLKNWSYEGLNWFEILWDWDIGESVHWVGGLGSLKVLGFEDWVIDKLGDLGIVGCWDWGIKG